MRRIFLRYPNKTRRFLEILVPALSWILITMPLWLSFSHPALVAYLIITFDVYWFYKSFTLTVGAIKSFLILSAHVKVDWLARAKECAGFEDLYHVIVIPEYQEPLHVLRRTLTNLTKQDFPKERIIIVFATEAKDQEARETERIVRSEFASRFGKFITTRHVLHFGEVAGKSSNMAWAAKHVAEKLKAWQIPIENVLITSCDADALLHPKYLSNLSFAFLTDPERYSHFYQGAIFFYSNIWRIPLPNKVFNTIASIWNLSLLSQPSRLINFSTYSVPLSTTAAAGGWGIDVIPEDYHIHFKVYFHKGKNVRTESIFLPVLVDAAEGHGFFQTFRNQYEQYKRWAWGVSDIPFVVREAILHSEIPLSDRLRRVIALLEQHIFWPANWFLLTLGSSLPPLINPAFARTVLGHNLARLSSSILTLSAVFLLVVAFIDWRMKPPRPKEYAAWKLPFLYLQWLTIPFISFFLSALPGLDAHTRLMLGRRLEYRVTEKL
ncbi:glycosyltransferase family 2 protein [Candidatus Gottesmanbacteria bacterium]|nr:glycosyltransferase family 2 protein [Candidatus Gottesmanbacteria bacterium]